MKTSPEAKSRAAVRPGKATDKSAHTPAKMHQALPLRIKRGSPRPGHSAHPEAERRALEDAVSGWWWL